MPSASVSVANTTLTRPAREQLLDDLLEGRQHAGVVAGDAARESLGEVVVAEDLEVGVGQVGAPQLDVRPDLGAAPPPWSAAARDASICSTAAAQPARLNTNTIAGSSAAASSRSTTSTRRRCPVPSARRAGSSRACPRLPPRRPAAAGSARHASRRGRSARSSGLTRAASSPSWSTNRSSSRRPTITCWYSGTGPLLLDHRDGVARAPPTATRRTPRRCRPSPTATRPRRSRGGG